MSTELFFKSTLGAQRGVAAAARRCDGVYTSDSDALIDDPKLLLKRLGGNHRFQAISGDRLPRFRPVADTPATTDGTARAGRPIGTDCDSDHF